jgi:hypothetical protein
MNTSNTGQDENAASGGSSIYVQSADLADLSAACLMQSLYSVE